MRFFGKFLGTHADYYVFETTLKSPPEEPEQQLGEHQQQLIPLPHPCSTAFCQAAAAEGAAGCGAEWAVYDASPTAHLQAAAHNLVA